MAEQRITLQDRRTLATLGANVRYLMEKCAIEPDNQIISIGVRNEAEKQKLVERMHMEFDATVMSYDFRTPHVMLVHGIWVCVQIANATAPPPKEAA